MQACLDSRSGWAFAALLLTVATPEARADVVGPPPDACPVGSVGDACHGGPFCRPIECQSDGDCGDGMVCQESKACIGGISCGGLEGGNDPPVPTHQGACSSGDTCTGTAMCQTLKLCVAPGDPTGGATGTGSGSSGSGGPGGTAGTAGTSNGSSGGGSASDSGGTGGSKGGCAACSTSGEPGGAALGLLALVYLRRRRPSRR